MYLARIPIVNRCRRCLNQILSWKFVIHASRCSSVCSFFDDPRAKKHWVNAVCQQLFDQTDQIFIQKVIIGEREATTMGHSRRWQTNYPFLKKNMNVAISFQGHAHRVFSISVKLFILYYVSEMLSKKVLAHGCDQKTDSIWFHYHNNTLV